MKVELRGLSKRFDKMDALADVSVEFEPGKLVAVLGLNGAGKSTLLRCMAAIAGPSSGGVYYDDELLLRDRLDLRRRFFFLPDVPYQFEGYSVLRNISITLRLFEADRAGVEDTVLQLLKDLDLVPHAKTAVQELSRGQIYKTGLASLLAVNPDLWLLDEPFSAGMDPQGMGVFRKHARAAAASGRTIIFTTQLLDVAVKFADLICVLHEGKIRLFESVESLRETREFPDDSLQDLLGQFREEDA
ncbi:MAG: ATP-binding cassette domain-containing protein [Verrucomicrobiia bacterium]|jgi:ABC-2 type transport system ATP-binding protein